jgi:hypothetical protein
MSGRSSNALSRYDPSIQGPEGAMLDRVSASGNDKRAWVSTTSMIGVFTFILCIVLLVG